MGVAREGETYEEWLHRVGTASAQIEARDTYEIPLLPRFYTLLFSVSQCETHTVRRALLRACQCYNPLPLTPNHCAGNQRNLR